MHAFKPDHEYSRAEVLAIVGLDDPGGGPWYTGYASHKGDWFIFCNVGIAGRTGHDYQNQFVGEELVWFGKTNSALRHNSIQSMLSPESDVYIFYREGDRSPFVFAGIGSPTEVSDTTPVRIVWGFGRDQTLGPERTVQELPEPDLIAEGGRKRVWVNIYERDPSARRHCIKAWGPVCSVCGFDFGKTFGELGAGFIQVHHLKPLGEIRQEYTLDPVKDLRPVCPNCHAMLHRRSPALSIDFLRSILADRLPHKVPDCG